MIGDSWLRDAELKTRHLASDDAWPMIEEQYCASCGQYGLDYWVNANGFEWQECSYCTEYDIIGSEDWVDFKLFSTVWLGSELTGVDPWDMQVRALNNEIRFIQTYGPQVSRSGKSISTRYNDEAARVVLKDFENFDDAVNQLIVKLRAEIDDIGVVIKRFALSGQTLNYQPFREHLKSWMKNQERMHHRGPPRKS